MEEEGEVFQEQHMGEPHSTIEPGLPPEQQRSPGWSQSEVVREGGHGGAGRRSGCGRAYVPGHGVWGLSLAFRARNSKKEQKGHEGGCHCESVESHCSEMGSLLTSHMQTIDNKAVVYGGG